MLHLAALAAVLFELGVPFLLLWRRGRASVVGIAFLFHLFNHYLLKLGFWHVLACDFCLVDWRRLQLRLGWGRRKVAAALVPPAGRAVLSWGRCC